MTDLTVALRLLADTEGAAGGLRQLAQQLRDLGGATETAGRRGREAGEETAAGARTGGIAVQALIDRTLGLDRPLSSAAASARAFAEALDAGDAARRLEAALDPVVAELRELEAAQEAVNRAVNLGAVGQAEAARVLGLAQQRYDGTAAVLGTLGQKSQLAAGQVGNLAAQFNDIGMMLAMGQNPLQLAIQQGTQITQVLGPMGAGGAARALGAAFMSLLSPVNLVTVAVIAGGAALVQWLMRAGEEAVTLEEALQGIADRQQAVDAATRAAAASTADLAREYGEMAEQAREALRQLEALALARAERDLGETLGAVRSTITDHRWLTTERADAMSFFNLREAMAGSGRGPGGGATPVPEELSPKTLLDPIFAAFEAFDDAVAMPEGVARLEEMAKAATRLRDAVDAAAQAYDGLTDQEKAVLEALNQQALAAMRLHEAARRAAQETDTPTDAAAAAPGRGTGGSVYGLYQASRVEGDRDLAELREIGRELQAQAALEALIARYGQDSAEVANARVAAEREALRLRLEALDVAQSERAAVLAQFDRENPRRDGVAERTAEAERLLATLQGEASVRQAIARYGEDGLMVERAKADVAAARVEEERRAFEAQVAGLQVSEDLAASLLEAWDAAHGLAVTDMAGGIGAATAEAQRLAQAIGGALSLAERIAGATAGARAAAAEAAGRIRALEQGAGPDAAAVEALRARRMAEAGDLAALPDGLANSLRAAIEAEAAAEERRLADQRRLAELLRPPALPATGGGGGGGGGAARDAVADLSAEVQQLLADLSLAEAAAAEKVSAGLQSVAGSSAEMAGAKRRAAERLAELVVRLEALGPAGRAAADRARAALGDLAREARTAGDAVRSSLADSFVDHFARSLATGRNAMSAFVDHVQTELARAFTRRFVLPLVQPLLTAIEGIIPFARGGVVGAVPALAGLRDRVIDAPVLFPMGGGATGMLGEAGAEAILPLLSGPRGAGVRAVGGDGAPGLLPLTRDAGGALAVALPDVAALIERPVMFAQGGVVGAALSPPSRPTAPPRDASMGPSRAVVVNIQNNAPATRVQAVEQPAADGVHLDVVVEQIEAALAERAQRGVGGLAAMIGRRHGLGRIGR